MTQELSLLKPFYSRNLPHPIYLIVFVTSRCIGRCKHCFYWREINQPENPLTVSEYERTAASMGKLLQVTFTGGEPFLRDDLPEIMAAFYKYNRPKNLGLATSGFHPERVVEGVKIILERCPSSNLTVGLPIEGLEELNDEIRGVPGFFARTMESYRGLRELKKHFKNLTLLIDVTVSSYNHDHLDEIYEFVRDEMRPEEINMILTRGEPREEQARHIDAEKVAKVLARMEADIRGGRVRGYGFFRDLLHAKDILLRRMSLDIYRDGKFRLPCAAGTVAGVLMPEGQVYPCELWNAPMGKLRDENYDMQKIWSSDAARSTRQKIIGERCTCYHQCFLSPTIFFNLRNMPALLREWARIKIRK
jgi:MoaA/NifB/PqqE/SkfB family radical SAM enzyme